MQEQDFPALYRSADELSLASQRRFYRALFVQLTLLVMAAFLSISGILEWVVALLQLLILLVVLSCSIYSFSIRPDGLWYAGRAVAESIKTITWRFVSRAEPFQGDDNNARNKFGQTLRAIIEQNRDVSQMLTAHLDGVQITQKMEELRAQPLEARRANYAAGRIGDQLTWYAKKATSNRLMSKRFFLILITVNALAVFSAALRIRYAEVPFWPTDVLVAAAASILSWMQAKKFSEQAASYALAAHEIGLIREQSLSPNSDENFSSFVGNTENAFSREHTQWVARKDR